jgi:diguanylate cyclase (GGDEF)-like protein
MKARIALKKVDFDRYRSLLRRLLPPSALCAFGGPDGTLIFADDAFPSSAVTIGRNSAPSLPAEGSESSAPVTRLRFSNFDLYAVPLSVEATKRNACLWVLIPATETNKQIPIALSSVGAVLQHTLDLNAELDDMATELIDRYEELNLVYHTEDQVNYFAEGQKALQQLLRNCCDYLSVDLAMLVMRGKGVTLTARRDGAENVDESALLEQARTVIYDQVLAEHESLVMNELDHAGAAVEAPAAAYRLVAAPLVNFQGTVDGLLVIVRQAEHGKFVNGDKNLLQVMARKAAKIVQVGYDALTGLVNRGGFEFYADELFKDVAVHQSQHCVLHVDIDQLHIVNDTVSHQAGDAVIQHVARVLRGAVRESDVVARLSGEEFGILIRSCPLKRGSDIAEKLRAAVMGLVIPWTQRALSATVSVGLSPINENTESANAAVAAAELACGIAKEMGKNRVHCFEGSDTGLMRRHHEMEAVGNIQSALKEDRLVLYAQRIESLTATAGGLHVEVLLRMLDGDGKTQPPGSFLPAAERYHMMPLIDRWVVGKTFAFLNSLDEPQRDALEMISINLSGQTLGEPGFADFLEEALLTLTVPLERICFEITETAAVQDLDVARRFMAELKNRGCRFALDDFGAGLSSFKYLRSLPVDFLKIDGEIVREITRDAVAASMVVAVHQVARAMGIETVAEYVESSEIVDALKHIGVSYGQGYALGKPQPIAEHFRSAARRVGGVAR